MSYFMTHKRCTRCGELKPLREFPVDRQKRTGLSPHCSDCNTSRVRAATLAYATRTADQIDADRVRLRPDGRKPCGACGTDLPVESFNLDRYKADGLQSWCRACQKTRKVGAR